MNELDHIDREWLDSVSGCLVDIIEDHEAGRLAKDAMIHGREDDRIFAEMDNGQTEGK